MKTKHKRVNIENDVSEWELLLCIALLCALSFLFPASGICMDMSVADLEGGS